MRLPIRRTSGRARRRSLDAAALLVRVFYICAFCIPLAARDGWARWLGADRLELHWPVAWIAWTGIRLGVPLVIAAALVAPLAAAALPQHRTTRAAAALALLWFGALWNSLGGGVVSHGLHAWIWVALVFVLLPDGTPDQLRASVGRAHRYRVVFWSAQAAVLLFYSLGGSFKVAGAIFQWANGEVHAFAPDALARHAAFRLLEGSGPVLLGSAVVSHPRWGWPFFMIALYLEVASIVVAFRPALHRAWGLALIAMHLGVFAALAILFQWQILLVGLLLVGSPFAPERGSAIGALRELPLFGDAYAWLRRRGLRRGGLGRPAFSGVGTEKPPSS